MHGHTWTLVWFVAASLWVGCDRGGEVATAGERPEAEPAEGAPANTEGLIDERPDTRLDPATFRRRYPWRMPAGEWPGVTPLSSYVEPPEGFERVDLEADSFGAFLRDLPVRLDRTLVKGYHGRRVHSPSAGVVALPMVDGDLQQCADSVLRLYAEYLWQADRRDEIAFHFTSGDRSGWADWRDGERFDIEGASVERYDGAPRENDREAFRGYLRHLFTYAGTMSLPMDARELEASEPTRPGDFFLESGSPGHVVVVLDVAENADGERLALIGQGFIPAQEFHLVARAGGAVWFQLPDEGEALNTPSWQPFGRDQRWRLE